MPPTADVRTARQEPTTTVQQLRTGFGNPRGPFCVIYVTAEMSPLPAAGRVAPREAVQANRSSKAASSTTGRVRVALTPSVALLLALALSPSGAVERNRGGNRDSILDAGQLRSYAVVPAGKVVVVLPAPAPATVPRFRDGVGDTPTIQLPLAVDLSTTTTVTHTVPSVWWTELANTRLYPDGGVPHRDDSTASGIEYSHVHLATDGNLTNGDYDAWCKQTCVDSAKNCVAVTFHSTPTAATSCRHIFGHNASTAVAVTVTQDANWTAYLTSKATFLSAPASTSAESPVLAPTQSPTQSPTLSANHTAGTKSESSGGSVPTWAVAVIITVALVTVVAFVAGRYTRQQTGTSTNARRTGVNDDKLELDALDGRDAETTVHATAGSSKACKSQSGTKATKGTSGPRGGGRGKSQQPRRFELIDDAEWHRCTRNGVKSAFKRLHMTSDNAEKQSQEMLSRILSGSKADSERACGDRPCFLVKRADGSNKKVKFQVQVGVVRLIAQKTIYVAYHDVDACDIGSVQVQQDCLYPDENWWCLEPTHLVRCEKKHVSPKVIKHPLPGAAHAVLSLLRKGERGETASRPSKKGHKASASALDSVPAAAAASSVSAMQAAMQAAMQQRERQLQMQLQLQMQPQQRQRPHLAMQQQQMAAVNHGATIMNMMGSDDSSDDVGGGDVKPADVFALTSSSPLAEMIAVAQPCQLAQPAQFQQAESNTMSTMYPEVPMDDYNRVRLLPQQLQVVQQHLRQNQMELMQNETGGFVAVPSSAVSPAEIQRHQQRHQLHQLHQLQHRQRCIVQEQQQLQAERHQLSILCQQQQQQQLQLQLQLQQQQQQQHQQHHQQQLYNTMAVSSAPSMAALSSATYACPLAPVDVLGNAAARSLATPLILDPSEISALACFDSMPFANSISAVVATTTCSSDFPHMSVSETSINNILKDDDEAATCLLFSQVDGAGDDFTDDVDVDPRLLFKPRLTGRADDLTEDVPDVDIFDRLTNIASTVF